MRTLLLEVAPLLLYIKTLMCVFRVNAEEENIDSAAQ